MQRLQGFQTYDSTSPWLSLLWGSKQKIEEASSEAMEALRELRERRLYRSTHHRFKQYLSARFGWSTEEIYPYSC